MPTLAYMPLVDFRLLSSIPGEYVDEIERRYPGFIDAKIQMVSSLINARLAKRYDAPFQAPYPTIVTSWVVDIVQPEVWLKRGVSSTDESYGEYAKRAEKADAQILEAANSETGLFELPLRGNSIEGGVVRGGPFAYTESSPYVQLDVQRDAARNEDRTRRGTTR